MQISAGIFVGMSVQPDKNGHWSESERIDYSSLIISWMATVWKYSLMLIYRNKWSFSFLLFGKCAPYTSILESQARCMQMDTEDVLKSVFDWTSSILPSSIDYNCLLNEYNGDGDWLFVNIANECRKDQRGQALSFYVISVRAQRSKLSNWPYNRKTFTSAVNRVWVACVAWSHASDTE